MLTVAFCFLLRSRYHTGSLAFGSLILSLVQVIRVLLEYLDHKLKGQDIKNEPPHLSSIMGVNKLAINSVYQMQSIKINEMNH